MLNERTKLIFTSMCIKFLSNCISSNINLKQTSC